MVMQIKNLYWEYHVLRKKRGYCHQPSQDSGYQSEG